MRYKNNDRKQGLSGLLRVKNEEATLAQSIDSCIDALDELIITYHECSDESVQIIESKKRQYPDKITLIPYPYHVIGVGATNEEYEYAKTLPANHPQLLATYYNNALQYVNYKFVMKIDADQIYFTQTLLIIREYIFKGVHQCRVGRFCGKLVNDVFCKKRENKRIRSKYHLLHWLQYVIVPLFKKQYKEYAVSEFLKGNGYLSLSGVNVLPYNDEWVSPLGCELNGNKIWPYNGGGDHLVFMADEHTEYLPLDYKVGSSKSVLIEMFDHPKEKTIFPFGFIWFHLRFGKDGLLNKIISHSKENSIEMLPVYKLSEVSSSYIMKHISCTDDSHYSGLREYYNFVHILDKKAIRTNITLLC